ncbi:MAG: hypothetical protein B7Y39_05215 [Bdellovibrio sp. 28-41-41]|nr:MAG: hypothetical protein B7Y39_05215 [Bdellovibrio sp. 28-41-41]
MEIEMSVPIKKTCDLSLHLINTRNPQPEQVTICEKAFRFWHKSWSQTFSKLGVEKSGTLPADDFLDREVIALFADQEPVALFFANRFDISRDSIIGHSYFKNYPKETIEELRNKNFKEVMVLTYMTVHENWRTKDTDIPMPDLLFSLAMMCFWESGLENLIGYIRKDKSFFQSFYRHGAIKISETNAYNVPVDFCYLTRDTSQLSPLPGVMESTKSLWKKMKEGKEPLLQAALLSS